MGWLDFSSFYAAWALAFTARGTRLELMTGRPWQDRWLLAGAYAIGLTSALDGFVGPAVARRLVVAAPTALRTQR